MYIQIVIKRFPLHLHVSAVSHFRTYVCVHCEKYKENKKKEH